VGKAKGGKLPPDLNWRQFVSIPPLWKALTIPSKKYHRSIQLRDDRTPQFNLGHGVNVDISASTSKRLSGSCPCT